MPRSHSGSRKNIKRPVIAIEGIHGVGKTTVFKMLQRVLSPNKFRFYPERLKQRPYWPFGSSDKNIAFRSEVHFIQQMIERNEMVQKDMRDRKVRGFILDRSAISVLVYSKALGLDSKDFYLLEDFFYSTKWLENILIYLEASVDTIYKRIKARGLLEKERLEWNEDNINYIKVLKRNYSYYIMDLKKKRNLKVIKINTDNKKPLEVMQEIKEIILSESETGVLQLPGQILLDSFIMK
ncbi:MAG: deoxynucleoside kinase [Promethearchaeota archaeon]